MKVLSYLHLISIFLFSLSVTLTLFDMASSSVNDEVSRLFGLPLSYYMVPLLAVNVLIMMNGMSQVENIQLTKAIGLWMILVPLLTMLNSKSIVTDLIRVLMWTTSYYASYIMVKINDNYERYLNYTFTVIFLTSCYFFFKGKETQMYNSNMGIEIGTNAVFCVLTVLPFVLMIGNRKLSSIAIFLALFCVIFSNKRSASIITAIALIPTVKSLFSSRRNSLVKYMLIIITIAACAWLFLYVSNNYLGGRIFNRFENMSEDGGSGRTEQWELVVNSFFNSNTTEMLFGHGHYAVADLGRSSASHNDFLDVVYDYGLVVFVIYLYIHYQIIKTTFCMWKQRWLIFESYFFMTVVFVVMSFISILVVQQRYLIYIGIYWGMIEALRDKECFKY